MLEEGILIHLHLVEEDPLTEMLEAEGLGIGDEVDLVAPGGQIQPKFRRHGPGPTIGGITGYPDFHSYPLPPRFSHSANIRSTISSMVPEPSSTSESAGS